MSAVFWWLALAGAGLLVVAAAILVIVNRGEQVYMQLLSSAAVGTITFMITFVASLKPSTQTLSLTTSVVEDTRSHLPVFALPDAEGSPRSMRASELSMLAVGVFAKTSDDKATASPPRIEEPEISRFYLELLQYLIVRDLRDHQRTAWSVLQAVTPTGGVSRPRISTRPTLTRPRLLKGDEALRMLSANRFAAAPFERLSWEHMPLLLPQSAGAMIQHDPGGEGTGPQRAVVSVSQPDSFTLRISVTPIGTGTLGFLPEGSSVRADDRAHCRTHHFVIDARADFWRLTAGSPRTEENKAWVQWILGDLEQRFKD